jgi:hypothetical protein
VNEYYCVYIKYISIIIFLVLYNDLYWIDICLRECYGYGTNVTIPFYGYGTNVTIPSQNALGFFGCNNVVTQYTFLTHS